MGIKSEMLKYAASVDAVENSTIQNVFQCFSFFSLFSFHFRLCAKTANDCMFETVSHREKDRGESTHAHTPKHNFMKSYVGITTKNKSKVQNEKEKKQQTTNNEVHTNTEMPATSLKIIFCENVSVYVSCPRRQTNHLFSLSLSRVIVCF